MNMSDEARLRVVFYRTTAGNEPVREWLKALPPEDRKIIGDDLKTAQYGWPLGMPLIRKLEAGLWEVRSRLRPHCACHRHRRRRYDGLAARLYHKVAKDAAARPATGQTAA